MYHISPQDLAKDGATRYNQPEPKLTLYRGASLAAVELGKTIGQNGKRHDWTRGEIKGFSKQSRRRILRIVATIRRDKKPVFCTLTYPDHFEDDPRQVKRQLDNFMKRLLRAYPGAVVLWRLEAVKRKSGENIGKIAPHFHLIVWGVPYLALLRFIPRAWFEVVGSGDERHLMAGTRVEPVRSVRGVLYYTSKYICKALDFELPGWGRYWGIVNRDLFVTVQGERQVIELDDRTAMTLLRYMRHRGSELYKKGRFIGRRKVPKWGQKYTLVCDAEFWFTALPKIQACESYLHSAK